MPDLHLSLQKMRSLWQLRCPLTLTLCFKFVTDCPQPGALPVVLTVKNPPANAGDVGSVTGSGRSPGEVHDNPLKYFCLENPVNRGAWWATVHRVAKCWTWLKQLSMHAKSWTYDFLFSMEINNSHPISQSSATFKMSEIMHRAIHILSLYQCQFTTDESLSSCTSIHMVTD